jgi:hypothetical protein
MRIGSQSEQVIFHYISPNRPAFNFGWTYVPPSSNDIDPVWRLTASGVGALSTAQEKLWHQPELIAQWESYIQAVVQSLQTIESQQKSPTGSTIPMAIGGRQSQTQPVVSQESVDTDNIPADAAVGLYDFVARSLRQPLLVETIVDGALLARTTIHWPNKEETEWMQEKMAGDWAELHTQHVALAGRMALLLLEREFALAQATRQGQEAGLDGRTAWVKAQQAANAVPLPQLPLLTLALQETVTRYFHYLTNRYGHLDFKGMGISDRVPLRLPLLDVYVPLQVLLMMSDGDTWAHNLNLVGRQIGEEEAEVVGRYLSKPRPILTLLQEHPGLIILGDPGAGKSTFLKMLALRLARSEDIGINQRIPLLVPLSAYAMGLAKRDVSLPDFISEYYHQMIDEGLPFQDMVYEALSQGEALLLLDGLDEVQEVDLRQIVIEQVVDSFAAHGRTGNKFIVTSRVAGYHSAPLSVGGLVECILVDFDDYEIGQLVTKWIQASELAAGNELELPQEESARKRDELLFAINHNPSLRQLLANPLLLSVLLLMNRQGMALPNRRVELYDHFVKILLGRWNLARQLDLLPTRDLDLVKTLRVLATLALWMHQTNPVGLVAEAVLQRELAHIFRALGGYSDPESASKEFLRDVREHAGLLLERGGGLGLYGFIHQTFQEYLAAVGVADLIQLDLQPMVDILVMYLDEELWHEVILLAIGYLGIINRREEDASEVLQRLVQQKPGEPGRAEIIAGEAVADMWPGGVTARCREEVVKALLLVMGDDARVKPVQRARAGQVLARLGDPRPQGTDVDQVVIDPDVLTNPRSLAEDILASLTAEERPWVELAVQHFDSLTPREREVTARLAAAHTYKNIADALNLSVKTVDNYVRKIYDKLGLDKMVDQEPGLRQMVILAKACMVRDLSGDGRR